MNSDAVSLAIPWSQVCRMFNKVQKVEHGRKKETLQRFIDQYRKLLKTNKEININATDTFFPVLRLLLPSLDRERGAYGVKEKKLADLYIKILGLHKTGTDAQRLLNFKKPLAGSSRVGDFAEVAFQVLRNRCQENGTLSLYDVDCHLTTLANCYLQKGKGTDVEKELLHMMRNMTADEQKWLIRVLLKEMHLRITNTTIFDCWHPDAKDYYDVNSSLLKLCTTLQDPNVRLHEIAISLFDAFRPMLAERVNLNKIDSQLKGRAYFSETKYDGERSQIHKSGSSYKYFSRNGFDFTQSFGADPTCGLFTPHLHSLFADEVKDIILDGEMVVWSKKHKTIIPKSANLDVKNVKEDGDWQVCFCPFDLIYLNGVVLTSKPLEERLQKLHKVVKDLEGRLLLTSRVRVVDSVGVIKYLNEAIDNREEGIVLKDPNSIYQPASRKCGWIKVKPDYVDSLVPELDMLIIGGYYGTGRKQGVIGQFLLAVADSNQEGCRPTVFHTAGKVASGYTDVELDKLLAKLSKHFIRKQPSNVQIGKENPDVWIEPEKSCVLQVKGAELIKTRRFKTEITLRFPRVETVRSDKSYYDICTSEELKNLFQQGGGKFMDKYDFDFIANDQSKKRSREVNKLSIASHFRPADISDVEKKSNLFVDKKLCIMTSTGKHDFERLVVEYGGTFTQNPDSDTFCVVADKCSVRVQNIIRSEDCNVVKKEWLLDCVREKVLLPWSPIDVWFLTEEDDVTMKNNFDQFGDSYTQPTDKRRLKRIINLMKEQDWTKLSSNEMQEMDELIDNSSAIFRRVKCFIMDANKFIGEENVTRLKLRLYGAKVMDLLDDEVTHVLIPIKCVNDVPVSNYVGKHVVTQEWVDNCISRGKYLDERSVYFNR